MVNVLVWLILRSLRACCLPSCLMFHAAKVVTKLAKISPNGNKVLTPGHCNTTQDRSKMFSTVVQEYIKHSQWSVTDTEAARYQLDNETNK